MTTSIILELHGKHSSLVLEFSPSEAPLWRYWGKKLHSRAKMHAPYTLFNQRAARSVQPTNLEFDQPLSTCVGLGLGWFSTPSLAIHRGGKDCFVQFNAARYEQSHTGDVQTLMFHLTDSIAQIEVLQVLSLNTKTDVLLMKTTLHNISPQGTEPLDVQWLAAGTLPLDTQCSTVQSYKGQWANEFLVCRDALLQGTWRRDTRRGRNGHDQFAGSLALTPESNLHHGLTYGMHLAWSGNHTQLIERLPDGGLQLQMGEWLAPGEIRLASGEQCTTPELVATCSPQGSNGVAQSFHAEARSRLKWGKLDGSDGATMRSRPVHINTWEAIYFDHKPEVLLDLATQSAAIGVERFVLDDGWFPARSDDHAGLGDWWPDAKKYPNGLKPLALEVERLGMEFGLWVEPEMVNPDSDLYRNHPDWALQINGRPMQTGRFQLVLDMARRDVQDYLFEKMDVLLTETPIKYLKWDMNRDLSAAIGQAGHAAYHSNSQGFYDLLIRIRTAHPHVEIESCASGGARIDMGVLPYVQRYWASDTNDALSRIGVQRGFTQFLPPEVMGAHVGPTPAHTTGRTQALPFRAAVALQGHFGIEFDVRTMDTNEKSELATWIDLYKSIRHVVHEGRTWQGDCGDGVVWQAYAPKIDVDATEDDGQIVRRLIVMVYRLVPIGHIQTPALRLPMLQAENQYNVRRIDPQAGKVFHHTSPYAVFSQIEAGTFESSGEWLAQSGLPLPRMKAEQAMVLELNLV